MVGSEPLHVKCTGFVVAFQPKEPGTYLAERIEQKIDKRIPPLLYSL